MHVLRINDVRKTYAAIKLLQKALPMHRFGLCCTVLRRRVQSKHRAPCSTHKLGLEWHQSVRVGPHVSLAEPVVDALSLGSDGDRPDSRVSHLSRYQGCKIQNEKGRLVNG